MATDRAALGTIGCGGCGWAWSSSSLVAQADAGTASAVTPTTRAATGLLPGAPAVGSRSPGTAEPAEATEKAAKPGPGHGSGPRPMELTTPTVVPPVTGPVPVSAVVTKTGAAVRAAARAAPPTTRHQAVADVTYAGAAGAGLTATTVPVAASHMSSADKGQPAALSTRRPRRLAAAHAAASAMMPAAAHTAVRTGRRARPPAAKQPPPKEPRRELANE